MYVRPISTNAGAGRQGGSPARHLQPTTLLYGLAVPTGSPCGQRHWACRSVLIESPAQGEFTVAPVDLIHDRVDLVLALAQARASQEQVIMQVPVRPLVTATGLPHGSGESRCSTAAQKAFMST
jgi:hypothetical protein